MKFQKAEVELILFDNSDVIVTSPGDLPCSSAVPNRAYCTNLGDSEKPNECENFQGRICLWSHQSEDDTWICTPTTSTFVNAPGPSDPVDM